jgi:hypothetical protein
VGTPCVGTRTGRPIQRPHYARDHRLTTRRDIIAALQGTWAFADPDAQPDWENVSLTTLSRWLKNTPTEEYR